MLCQNNSWRFRTVFSGIIFATILLYLSNSNTSGFSRQFLDGSKPSTSQSYQPGRIGKGLVRRYNDLDPNKRLESNQDVGTLNTADSESGLFGPRSLVSEEAVDCQLTGLPEGFIVGNDPISAACERLALWKEISSWVPDPSLVSRPVLANRNLLAIDRLTTCLLRPLPLQPVEKGGCSIKTKQVVLGAWDYLTVSFMRVGTIGGEHIWMLSMIEAMEEEGYTILAAPDYKAMIQTHAEIPNLITHILAEDRFVLTCLTDPECIAPADFKTTRESYPFTDVDADGKPIWTDSMQEWYSGSEEKWYWTEEDVQQVQRRGTIPRWKLFIISWWAVALKRNYWQAPEEFTFNPLGQEWSLAPFAYPNYTHIPFSIEKACSQVPDIPKGSKTDEIFILAKKAEYYYETYTAPPFSVWETIEAESGMSVVSMAQERLAEGGRQPFLIPEGITKIDRMSREGFEARLATSKVMLGIGYPMISPSVYDSLCQGTPVVLPIYHPIEELTGYNVFSERYGQHGPASLIGPPYVYSYQAKNTSEMFEMIHRAATTPIPRYIPPEMTWEALKQDINDVLLFDWKRLAERIVQVEPGLLDSPHRLEVMARCHALGRCEPVTALSKHGK